MIALPNPFASAVAPAMVADSVAGPCLTDPTDPAADLIDGPDIPMAELLRRGFDPDGFINDCERLPAFLSAPSQEYLRANDLIPMLRVLAGR